MFESGSILTVMGLLPANNGVHMTSAMPVPGTMLPLLSQVVAATYTFTEFMTVVPSTKPATLSPTRTKSIIELGAAEWVKVGPETSPGTAIFSISGNVVRPGNYELELGTPMRELIYELAGGIPAGRELKAVIPGGSSVPALTPDQIDVPLDYDSLGALGTFFGAASLIVVDDSCCMVQLALRSTKFYMHESCGKCTPCREGTRWMVQLLEKIEAGDATLEDVELLRSVCDRILGKSLCALGDFAVYPVASYMKHWGDEFTAHVEQGGCPFDGESTLVGIVAPSDAHAHAEVHA